MKPEYIKFTSATFWAGVGSLVGCVLGVLIAHQTEMKTLPLWMFIGGTILGGLAGYLTGGISQAQTSEEEQDHTHPTLGAG